MLDILFKPVSSTLQIKPETLKALARLDIHNIRDLLFYRPSNYQIKDISPNLSALQEGQLIQAEVIVQDVLIPSTSRSPTKIMVGNETGSILLVFFNKIPPFIFQRLKIGSKHIISGKVQFFDYYFQIAHPEFILQKQLESALEPIYPLTYLLVNKQLYSYILQAFKYFEESITEENITNPYFIELLADLKILHLINAAPSPALIEQNWRLVVKKLAEKELFANQLLLAFVRSSQHTRPGRIFSRKNDIKQTILNNLGFTLTSAQKQVIAEIEKDQRSGSQMMRLLQGDVGSGKTLVALLTMVNVAASRAQSALMVPTDLLANQHYNVFEKALVGTGLKVALLTGKVSAKERKVIMEELGRGEIHILIGTHALFQEKVNFKDLGYIIIDEQHRFGVEQRLRLINKASLPDVLVMTATPIPRSLTLTMFGDLTCSKLMTKPKNRLPIITTIVPLNKIDDVALAINKKVASGERVYWVCPLVTQKEKEDLGADSDLDFADVTSRFATLEQIYPNKVGLVHGKMSGDRKDEAMEEFKDGVKQILVATTVIEVGIDVADATLIIIENAEKFGLTQLHQLRGRVGRGDLQSYCILLYNPQRLTENAKKRLKIMRDSNDGFYLAEQDLILRGSGEILGIRQSGEPQFFFADLSRDIDILLKVNKLTSQIQKSDFIDFQIKLFARSSENFANIY